MIYPLWLITLTGWNIFITHVNHSGLLIKANELNLTGRNYGAMGSFKWPDKFVIFSDFPQLLKI